MTDHQITIIAGIVTVVAAIATVASMCFTLNSKKQITRLNKSVRGLRESIDNAVTRTEDVEKQLSTNTQNLGNIYGMLTTRYLGKSKEFSNELIELIKSAEESLTVVCDTPTYAFLSNRTTYLDYEAAIKSTAHSLGKGNVEFYFPSRSMRHKTLLSQLNINEDGTDWETWKGGSQPKAILKSAIDNYRLDSSCIDKITQQEFIDFVDKYETDFMLNSLCGHTQYCFNFPMPIYFWVADGKRALYVIPSHEVDDGLDASQQSMNSEHGFTTKDLDFIRALNEMLEKLKKQKTDCNS